MAVLLPGVFGGQPVPQTEGAKAEIKERRAQAEQLRELLLSRQYTREVYGPDSMLRGSGAGPEDLMPTPDEAAGRFNNGKYSIYDDMGRNVLEYGGDVEGVIDTVETLEATVHPGQKGDKDSEFAAEAVRSLIENLEEKEVSFRNADRAFERGFSPLEVVYDEHTRGAARGLVGAIKLMDRPLDWYAFDYLGRPRFKREYFDTRAEVVPEWKVAFARSGSLHSKWGRGYGQDCYPTVWAIDAARKGYAELMERAGYMPVVVEYPNSWGPNDVRLLRLKNSFAEQWKNAVFVPGEVEKVSYHPMTEGAYASANAAGPMRLQYIDKLVAALAMRIQGTMYSSGNQQSGSFARDQVADTGRLYKAPSFAAVKEAMINRGVIEPFMLVNFPWLEKSQWPRYAIDASFGEDLRLFMELFASGRSQGIQLADVTWSERTGIPLAVEGDVVSKAPAAVVADPNADPDAVDNAVAAMSEPWITVTLPDGMSQTRYHPDALVFVERLNKPIRAALLANDDVIVDDPARFRPRAV